MNDSPAHLDALRRDIETAETVMELEAIIAGTEGVKARAYAKMMMLATSGRERRTDDAAEQDHDLIDVHDAAKMLGMSERYVRDHGEEFGRIRLGRSVRYSPRRIAAVIRRKSCHS